MASQIYEEQGLSVVSFARPGGPFLQFDAREAVLDRHDARKLIAALENYLSSRFGGADALLGRGLDE